MGGWGPERGPGLLRASPWVGWSLWTKFRASSLSICRGRDLGVFTPSADPGPSSFQQALLSLIGAKTWTRGAWSTLSRHLHRAEHGVGSQEVGGRFAFVKCIS